MIVNPTAGRRRHQWVNEVVAALHILGCEVTLRTTEARGDAGRLAAKADPEHFDVLAVAGGDGTINEVLNGMAENAPPLAIVPLGTANVLAAEIGLPPSVQAIADTIAFGRAQRVSLGEVNGRRFAVMASVGLDADVVDKVNLKLKRHIGKGAYLAETLRQLLTLKSPTYRLRIDGIDQEAHGVIIANGRHYGGRFIVAPGASLLKPDFDVCRCIRPGRRAAVGYIASMALGRLAERQDYQIDTVASLDITGPAGAPVQADGDILTTLPATIRALPEAIKLIYPPEQACNRPHDASTATTTQDKGRRT